MKYNSLVLKVLCGVVAVSGTLAANEKEEEKKDNKEHIVVGSRELSKVERVKIQENRERMTREKEDKSCDENEESGAAQPSIKSSRSLAKGPAATVYYTTHEGAWHSPIAVSLAGDAVELEDGSIWSVYSGHAYRTLDWMTGDTIIITPNDDLISVYDYRLVNLNTGASVKVNLALGPIYNGIYTHWVVAINYTQREILLEDGSIWKMSTWDSSIVDKWLVNDTVIIGVNNSFLTGSNKNILINVNMNNYAVGNCLN